MEPQAPQLPEVMPIQPEMAPGQPSVLEVAPAAPTPEVKSESKEGANQGQAVQLPPVVAEDPLPPPPPVAGPVGDVPGVVVTSPPVADDVDIIEKEWVVKAKSIVEKTKEDPHQQSTEVSMLKADYLKKRYGKELKVTDS